MLTFYGLSSYKDVIRDWYDGYRFGDTDVYCPWDVINYCDELLAAPGTLPKNYWANTSGNGLILRLLEKADQTTKDEVEELLNGGKITKRVRQELTYRDIEDSVGNVWSVLYATGYLTGRHVDQADADIFRLWIPNGEIHKLFYELAEDWFREVTQSDTERINRFCAAFPAGDINTIQEMLNDYLWDSVSVRDTAVHRNMKENVTVQPGLCIYCTDRMKTQSLQASGPSRSDFQWPGGVTVQPAELLQENFYHGMLLGLLRSQGSWLVKSNAEMGEGYSDISIQTPDRVGMIIELKYAEDGNLEAACAEALNQIEEKKYAEGLKRRGAKKMMKYGIAFCEKECMVVMA